MVYCASLENVLLAKERVSPYIHKTPVIISHALNKKSTEASGGHERIIHLKCEHLQKTGSFKPRGMINTVLELNKNKDCKGVVTDSSGNAGMSLAYAAGIAGIPCAVVTPRDSPKIKAESIKGYGAEVFLCEPNPQARTEMAGNISKERGYIHVSSYNRDTVIAGQGTMAVELLEQVPELDAIFCSASGGGMIAGITLATKGLNPKVKVYAVEPKGKELGPSLQAGERLWPNPPRFVDTIADGLRHQQLGMLNWPIVRDMAEKKVFTINNDQITDAMRFTWMRTKQVVETSAAITVAAVISDQMRDLPPEVKNIGVILCGGNVDLDKLPWVVKSYYD